MKKFFFVFALFISLACAKIFAAHDFVIAPTAGYTASVSFPTQNNVFLADRLLVNHFSLGLDLGLILDNGFTYIQGSNFLAGFARLRDLNFFSILVETNSTIGYTFRPKKNIHINILGGVSIGLGVPKFMQLGLPVHLGFQYYFSEKVGINITAVEMPVLSFTTGIENYITLKIGPVFKL